MMMIDSLFIKTASQPKAELCNYLQKLYNTWKLQMNPR